MTTKHIRPTPGEMATTIQKLYLDHYVKEGADNGYLLIVHDRQNYTLRSSKGINYMAVKQALDRFHRRVESEAARILEADLLDD